MDFSQEFNRIMAHQTEVKSFLVCKLPRVHQILC